MYCKNCGASVSSGNFCQYCGERLTDETPSISLISKAVSTANLDDRYNLVLISCGTCSKVTTGDLLEDIFGYTDDESSTLVNMAPVVVGERLNANEAATVAQLLTEYGVQVSITNQNDQYVDLTSKATTSVFDAGGNLLSRVAAVIGALTVTNRIRSYRRYKRPSLLDRLFRVNYRPNAPTYRRNFRPRISTAPVEPRRTIRKTPQAAPYRPAVQPVGHQTKPAGRPSSPGPSSHGNPGSHSPSRGGSDPHPGQGPTKQRR